MRLAELKTFLLRKKYPEAVIHSGIERASQLNREDLLMGQSSSGVNESSNNIPFVYTNNCANPNILSTVRRGLDILLPSDRMKTVMKDKKIVAARRQPRNMKALLFRPRFETTQKPPGSILSCKDDPNRTKTRGRPCKCCDLLQQCSSFKFEGSDEPFELRYHFTCDTKNVLYAITCLGCGHDYIGKTEREVRERCGEYRLAIENKKFTQGVHKHIADCGGNFHITPYSASYSKNSFDQNVTLG